MTDLLDRLRRASVDALADEPVAAAYVYGSQAEGTSTPRSDVDVAVLLDLDEDVDVVALRLRLARKLEQRVSGKSIDVIVLDSAPLALAGRVHERGKLFYCRDDVRRVRCESLISRMFHDFKVHEERSARERIAHMARGS